MTVEDNGSTIIYYTPPLTIFDIVPYKNIVGEKVICIDDYQTEAIKKGGIYTVAKHENGYIWLEEFKDFLFMNFSCSRFKKLKATYDSKEYYLKYEQGGVE